MKRWKKALAILVLAAAVAAGGALAASHVLWGRSLRATAYELVLRCRNAHPLTPEEETARLEAKRAEGEKPYVPPAYLKFDVPMEEGSRRGMQTFTLNPGGGAVTVLYIHGGAHVNAFNAYQWRFMNRLARETGCEIVAPAYHLAPFGDCTRGCEDVAGLFAELEEEAPARRYILMGDSAGGGLAFAAAEELAARGGPQPERLVLLSPWVDVTMENPEAEKLVAVEPMLHMDLTRLHGRYWAGEHDPHAWQASPLYGDMAGLPPVALYCGTRELLYPDILRAEEQLRAAGVDVTLRVGRGLNHDFPLMPIPEADRAFAEIAALVRGEAG